MGITERKIVALDFDGVCNSYISGWVDALTIPDAPVEGLFEWLDSVTEEFFVVIHSSRLRYEGGEQSIREWFWKWCQIACGDEQRAFHRINMWNLKFSVEKPPATLSIDDRGFCFEGKFPSVEFIKAFQPWRTCGSAGR